MTGPTTAKLPLGNTAKRGSKSGSLQQRIYALARQVPPGRVVSYGAIARHVGCSPRTVGFALASLPHGSDVPWQRVINSQGKISQRENGEGNLLQRELLEIEGVRFDLQQRVDWQVYGWTFPAESGSPPEGKAQVTE